MTAGLRCRSLFLFLHQAANCGDCEADCNAGEDDFADDGWRFEGVVGEHGDGCDDEDPECGNVVIVEFHGVCLTSNRSRAWASTHTCRICPVTPLWNGGEGIRRVAGLPDQ